LRSLYQEIEVEAEVDREENDEEEDMVVREMADKRMNMKMEAIAEASTISKI